MRGRATRESSPGFGEFGQRWLSSMYTRAGAAKSFCTVSLLGCNRLVTHFDLPTLPNPHLPPPPSGLGEGRRTKLISPCARTPLDEATKTQRRIKIYTFAGGKFNRQWRRALKTSRRHGRASMAPAPTFYSDLCRFSVGSPSVGDARVRKKKKKEKEKETMRPGCICIGKRSVYIGVYVCMCVCTW